MIATAQRRDWLPLLQRLLASLRRSRETPLQFEIDAVGIVGATLADLSPDEIQAPERIIEALDELVEGFLCGDEDSPSFSVRGPLSSRSLVSWVEDFYQSMRSVHASAIDILALRVEGYESRDIADRLGLGLRQVHSILREMRVIWAGDRQSG